MSSREENTPLSDRFIYGLTDPRSGELRYVGRTTVGRVLNGNWREVKTLGQ